MNKKVLTVKTESSLGGLLLLLGTTVILITILFEYRIGWIGVDRRESEVPNFIFETWSQLKLIWGWQLVGFLLLAIAYAILLKNSDNLFKSLLWAILLLFGLMIVIAFGITLGAYYPALQVYESQPVIFDSIRGAVRSLYSIGLLTLPFLGVVYLLEVFGRNGVIERRWGMVGLSIVVAGILLNFIPSLPGQLIGAVVFFIPAFLGYAYWRNNHTHNRKSQNQTDG